VLEFTKPNPKALTPGPWQDFSEWAQCQVLEFISLYRPSGEQEIYDFMNVLDDRLNHSNSAVVMATVKVFLHYTISMPTTHQQVRGACLSI
jgi:vesicle coat complex subunit